MAWTVDIVQKRFSYGSPVRGASLILAESVPPIGRGPMAWMAVEQVGPLSSAPLFVVWVGLEVWAFFIWCTYTYVSYIRIADQVSIVNLVSVYE